MKLGKFEISLILQGTGIYDTKTGTYDIRPGDIFLYSTNEYHCITDIFALVTGSLVGKTPLSKKFSPNKTIEGLIGGTVMGTILATMFYLEAIPTELTITNIVIITMTLSLIGQLGDLVFSSVKRYYNKKDFSNLIPGHGGILDRFDSIIFVALASSLFLFII